MSRETRVVKLQISKPINGDWDALGKLLRDLRYRAWIIANEFITQKVAAHIAAKHDRWAGGVPPDKPSIAELNRRFGERLRKKGEDVPGSALNGYLSGGLHQQLGNLFSGKPWKEFCDGKRAAPTMRLNMPLRIQGNGCRVPLHWSEEHDGYVIGFGLRVGLPGQRNDPVVLVVRVPHRDHRANNWLHELCNNPDGDESGWRARSFEISEDDRHRWWLNIAYDRPKRDTSGVDPTVICHAVIDYEVPLTAWCGKAVLGPDHTNHLGHRIKQMRNVIGRRRREIQRGGKDEAARCGHGRDRKLQPTEVLRGRIDKTQTSINHALSRMLVKFAIDNGAGVIRLEDTGDLKDQLKGTLLGINWRYHDLHSMVEYKADEHGITVEYISGEDMEAATGFKREAGILATA